MNPIEVKMDDLPILPFEKILSYLNLKDRIMSRAVSRSWRAMFEFSLKSLYYSDRPISFVKGKSRWVSGAFVRNFISSPRFGSFFIAFAQTILFNLQHLRLCGLCHSIATFARALNSLHRLEELDIVQFTFRTMDKLNPNEEFELNLPMLNRVHFESIRGNEKLTLDAPKLHKVKLVDCSLRVEFTNLESVEKLITSSHYCIRVQKLKNLKYLYCGPDFCVDRKLLKRLEQLKELHLNAIDQIPIIFDRKRRYCRADLTIFCCGCRLNGPDDPAINSLSGFFPVWTINYLSANPTRLADEIPFCNRLTSSAFEAVPDERTYILKKFTDLIAIDVISIIQNTSRFQNLLQNFDYVLDLRF